MKGRLCFGRSLTFHCTTGEVLLKYSHWVTFNMFPADCVFDMQCKALLFLGSAVLICTSLWNLAYKWLSGLPFCRTIFCCKKRCALSSGFFFTIISSVQSQVSGIWSCGFVVSLHGVCNHGCVFAVTKMENNILTVLQNGNRPATVPWQYSDRPRLKKMASAVGHMII